MNHANDQKLRELLKSALPPVGDAVLRRDLWPQMLRKMEERSARVPWFDWALAALVLGWLFFWPELIPVLLYHL